MTTIPPSWCNYCKHYKLNGTCKAFPDGIPGDILFEVPHSSPVAGQVGDTVFTLDMRKQEEFNDAQPYLMSAEESVR